MYLLLFVRVIYHRTFCHSLRNLSEELHYEVILALSQSHGHEVVVMELTIELSQILLGIEHSSHIDISFQNPEIEMCR